MLHGIRKTCSRICPTAKYSTMPFPLPAGPSGLEDITKWMSSLWEVHCVLFRSVSQGLFTTLQAQELLPHTCPNSHLLLTYLFTMMLCLSCSFSETEISRGQNGLICCCLVRKLEYLQLILSMYLLAQGKAAHQP